MTDKLLRNTGISEEDWALVEGKTLMEARIKKIWKDVSGSVHMELVYDTARVARLKAGNWQFGHDGTHRGIGTESCPDGQHHHHDEFCDAPTLIELMAAGIDRKGFKVKSRE
jgi:hypothetical protein